MDVSAALEVLVPAANYGGSLTDNTEASYAALRWLDDRAKPAWSALQQVVVPSPVPVLISRRQTIEGLVYEGFITEDEAVASNMIVPAGVEAVIAQLPEGERTSARVRWLNFTEAYRDDMLVAALALARGKDTAAVDDYFRAWALL